MHSIEVLPPNLKAALLYKSAYIGEPRVHGANSEADMMTSQNGLTLTLVLRLMMSSKFCEAVLGVRECV